MHSCKEYRVQLMLYMDDELDQAERSAVEARLRDCPACRAKLDQEREFLDRVRQACRPPEASDDLRRRVAAIVDDTAGSSTVTSTVTGWPHRPKLMHAAALSALVLLLAAGLWVATATFRPWYGTAAFAATAVDVHQRHLLGQLPLEVVTDVPESITRWFDGKVAFSLRMPNYQQASGQEKRYRLQGARLIGFQDDYAAFVVYRMDRSPISLTVTSSAVAEPSGGATITSKGIEFHYEYVAGFKVITWTHHGLTYALVSDLNVDGQQACSVCHQDVRDQDLIKAMGL